MKFTLSYWEKECDGHWTKIQKTLIVDLDGKLNIELPKGIYLDAVTLIKAEGQENSHPAKIMKRKEENNGKRDNQSYQIVVLSYQISEVIQKGTGTTKPDRRSNKIVGEL